MLKRLLAWLFPPLPGRCPQLMGKISQCERDEGHTGKHGIGVDAMAQEMMLAIALQRQNGDTRE